jgi:hypothetical protein
MAIHHTWFKSFVSKLFLDGLNQEFDLRRQLIFSDWPSLDDTISNIIEEETRLSHSKVDDYKGIDIRAALSIKNNRTLNSQGVKNKTDTLCDHCGREGHTIKKCFKLHGFSSGWKKGRTQPGGARGGKWNQANHTQPDGELLVVDVQALKEYKSKLKVSEGSTSSQGSSTTASSFHATSQGIKPYHMHLSKVRPKPWIIDSGATNHMTGASNLFTSYTPCSGKDKVRVADGSMAPITGRGSVQCT